MPSLGQLAMSSNPEAERAFLASCLISQDFAENNIEKLSDDYFSCEETVALYREMRNVVSAGRPVSYEECVARLRDKIEGSDEFMVELMEQTRTSQGGKFLLKELEDNWRVRGAARAIIDYIKKPTDQGSLDDMTNVLLSLSGGNKEHIKYSIGEVCGQLMDRIQHGTGKAVKLGIDALDSVLNVRLGNLIYIIAPPKTGKTWFESTLAMLFGRSSLKTLFVSAESEPTDLVKRMASFQSGSDLSRIDNDNAPQHKIDTFCSAANVMRDMPIELIWAVGMNVSQLQSLMKSSAKSGTSVVLIDYIQRLRAPSEKDRRLETEAISRMLADQSKKLGLLVVCASQAGRASRHTGLTEIYHGKESGAIEEDADAVITLTDTTDYSSITLGDSLSLTLKIAQRNGVSGIKELSFNPRTGRYE